MKRILPITLLFALVSTYALSYHPATSYYPVNVSNGGVLNPLSTVDISARIDSSDDSYGLSIKCYIQNPYAPFKIRINVPNPDAYDISDSNWFLSPGEKTLESGITYLYIETHEKDLNVTIDNLDDSHSVNIHCTGIY